MTNSNSVSLDTPLQKVKRLLLSSTFNVKQSNILLSQINPYLKDLSQENFEELIDVSLNKYKLRTAPLLLALLALKENKLNKPKETLKSLLVNAKLLTTSLDMYYNINGNVKPLAAPLKKALAERLTEMDNFNLIKGNVKVNNFKLVDVLKLTHPKPINDSQSELFKQIIENNTPSLDTWETIISTCKTDQERHLQWERLLLDGKIKDLTFIRNLNNLTNNRVNLELIHKGFDNINLNKVNVFHLLNSISNVADHGLKQKIQDIINTINDIKLTGETLVIFDVSGSMQCSVDTNAYTDKNRLDIANMLTYYLSKVCENITLVYTAGNDSKRIARSEQYQGNLKTLDYRDLVDITRSFKDRLGMGGIFTRQALEWCQANVQGNFERIIVISDSEDCDRNNTISNPHGKYNYLLNIARNNNNIVFNTNWTAEIAGWSESLPDFIKEYEDTY